MLVCYLASSCSPICFGVVCRSNFSLYFYDHYVSWYFYSRFIILIFFFFLINRIDVINDNLLIVVYRTKHTVFVFVLYVYIFYSLLKFYKICLVYYHHTVNEWQIVICIKIVFFNPKKIFIQSGGILIAAKQR